MIREREEMKNTVAGRGRKGNRGVRGRGEVANKGGCMQAGNVMTIVSPSLTVMQQPALRQVRQMVN